VEVKRVTAVTTTEAHSTMAGMDLGAAMAPFQHGDDDGGSIGRA
jgi:hypothetical protein